jgi:hypothetical protein
MKERKTEMSGTVRKIQIVIGTIALVFAFCFGAGGHLGIQSASAVTIGTDNGGWTPENFASSCKASGGRVVEIDSPGIKYSKCYFPGGGVNKCDWITKICTFGIVSGPFKDRVASVSSGTLTTTGSSGSGTTTGTNRTASGTLSIATDE